MSTQTTIDLAPVLAKLDALATQVAYLTERQRKQEELFEEFTPIARVAMATVIERFDALDKQGVFESGKELVGIGQKIVEAFKPEDVRQLGDAVVSILDTVRALTQPEVLAIAGDAAQAMREADDAKPLGIFGLVRATKHEDVQKGMALMVEVLKRIGHGANALSERHQKQLDRKAKLAELLGPRSQRGKALGIERPQRRLPAPAAEPPAAKAPACSTPKPAVAATRIDGIDFTADGHVVDATQWTRELGVALAELAGLALTEAHWTVLTAARTEFEATQLSPNIRRLTQVTGLSTKDLYTLFPKAPARTIAKVAGLPKPAGCL